MEKALLQKLAQISKEEQKILSGEPLDIRQYAIGESFIISDKKMTGGKADIAMRIHTRFAPFPTHSHNYMEIMTVISGSITHFISKKRIKLSKGDILLMNKHVSHSVERAEREDIGINIIASESFLSALSPNLSDTVFSEFVKENAKASGEPAFLHFKTEGIKEIENLTENLLFCLTEQKSSRSITEKTLSLLLEHLSLHQEELLVEGSSPRSKIENRKSEIIAYIRDNYPTATLKELSKLVFLSTPHLSKLISDYFGKTFKELLVEERIKRAIDLFENSDMPISAVIRSVGYENESYFHREFKRRCHSTPLNIRKTAKNEFLCR